MPIYNYYYYFLLVRLPPSPYCQGLLPFVPLYPKHLATCLSHTRHPTNPYRRRNYLGWRSPRCFWIMCFACTSYYSSACVLVKAKHTACTDKAPHVFKERWRLHGWKNGQESTDVKALGKNLPAHVKSWRNQVNDLMTLPFFFFPFPPVTPKS